MCKESDCHQYNTYFRSKVNSSDYRSRLTDSRTICFGSNVCNDALAKFAWCYFFAKTFYT